jgi:hypothetical protein
MATGVVYFHRFFMVHIFQDFPRYVRLFKIVEYIKTNDDLLDMYSPQHLAAYS